MDKEGVVAVAATPLQTIVLITQPHFFAKI